MNIVVLGCGPAGLFAAQAVESITGRAPAIISKKHKSEIYGAQYLHRAIPELCSPAADSTIQTIRVGSAAGYAQRVYGDVKRVTSWERVQSGPQPIWNLRAAYDKAWEKFQAQIINNIVSPSELEEFALYSDLVISTVPKWSVCLKPREHQFNSIPIFVTRKATSLFLARDSENFVIYNGMENSENWYRTSRIFGHESTEHVHPNSPTRIFADVGFKVVGNDCDCHPNVVFAGRMGKWEAGVLTHNAYEDTVAAFSDRAVV